MMLYFIPTDRPVKRETLKAVGLAHAMDGAGEPRAMGCAGPDALNGYVFASGGRVGALYKPELQDWQTGPDGKFWLGWPKGEPPGPEMLLRDDAKAGHDLVLGDGNTWTIPIIRSPLRPDSLPRALRLGTDGLTWEQSYMPKHAALVALAERAWASVVPPEPPEAIDAGETPVSPATGTPPPDFTWGDGLAFVTAALQLNYRVGTFEVSALGLLDTHNVGEAVRAAVDWPFVVAAVEKRTAARTMAYVGSGGMTLSGTAAAEHAAKGE